MIRRFNRFELKYVVPARLRDALCEDIRANMAPDPKGEDGTYPVTSLYYDSADFQFFRSKVDGIKYRRKIRVRVYGGLNSSLERLGMVEIKQRINRTTQKRRLAIPLGDAFALCGSPSLHPFEWALEDPKDREVAQEITFLVRTVGLHPSCVISYVRQAFVGSQYEPGLRLTFDRGLWCAPPTQGLAPPDIRRYFLPPDWVVMEVKANEAVPLWVSRMLARHRCELTRYSKYCSGLAHLQQEGIVRVGYEGAAEWMS